MEYKEVLNGKKKLIILLHGYGASMDDLYPLHQMSGEFDYLFPNGVMSLDMGFSFSGRAWFQIDMESLEDANRKRDFDKMKDAIPHGLDFALKDLSSLIKNKSENYEEVILGGFSQGAMMTSLLLKDFPHIKKAIFLSGALIASSYLASNYSHLSFFESHGEVDSVLGIEAGEMLYHKFLGLGAKGEFFKFYGAHEINHDVLKRLQRFILT